MSKFCPLIFGRSCIRFNQKSVISTPIIKMVQCSDNDELKLGEKTTNSKNSNFVFSIRPIHYISRVCGLMPFSIIQNSNGEVQEPRISTFDGLWFSISICIYLAMTYIFYQHARISTDPNTKSYFLVLGDYMLYIAVMIYGILVRGMDMFNRFKLVDILRKFTEFDKEVGQFISILLY